MATELFKEYGFDFQVRSHLEDFKGFILSGVQEAPKGMQVCLVQPFSEFGCIFFKYIYCIKRRNKTEVG